MSLNQNSEVGILLIMVFSSPCTRDALPVTPIERNGNSGECRRPPQRSELLEGYASQGKHRENIVRGSMLPPFSLNPHSFLAFDYPPVEIMLCLLPDLISFCLGLF